MTEFPAHDTTLTHLLVVSDMEKSRDWYTRVLGPRSTGSTAAHLLRAAAPRLADQVVTKRAADVAFAPRGVHHTFANLRYAPPKLAAIHAGDWLLKLLVIAVVVSVWS